MRLDVVRARGVSKGRLGKVTNPMRSVLWRLLVPWFEAVAEQVPDRTADGSRIDLRAYAHRLASIEQRLGMSTNPVDVAPAERDRVDELQRWVERLADENGALRRRLDDLDSAPHDRSASLVVAATGAGRFLVHSQDLIGRTLLRGVEWEPHVARAIETHADPARSAIDAGASIGVHAVRMARHFGRVLAFEPQADIFQLLRGNLALNGLENVEALPKALYDRECALHTPPNAAFVFSPRPEAEGGSVEATTVDALDIADLGFLKVDAQGAAFRVLRGAARTIARCRPAIVFEHERDLAAKHGDTLDDALSLLAGFGYEVELLASQREGAQADYIALPA